MNVSSGGLSSPFSAITSTYLAMSTENEISIPWVSLSRLSLHSFMSLFTSRPRSFDARGFIHSDLACFPEIAMKITIAVRSLVLVLGASLRLTHASRQHDPTMSLSCQLGGECPEWDDFPTAAPTASSMLAVLDMMMEENDHTLKQHPEESPLLLINLRTMTTTSAATGTTRKDQAKKLSPPPSTESSNGSQPLLAQRFPVKKKGYRWRQKLQQHQEVTSIARKPRENKRQQEEHSTNSASTLDEQQTNTQSSTPATRAEHHVAATRKRQITHKSRKKLVRRKKQQSTTASTVIYNVLAAAAPGNDKLVASRPHQPNIADSTAGMLEHNIPNNQETNDTPSSLSKKLTKSRCCRKKKHKSNTTLSSSLNDDQQPKETISGSFPESEQVTARPPPGRVVVNRDSTQHSDGLENHWSLWKQQLTRNRATR